MKVKPVVAPTKPIGDLFAVLTLLRPGCQAPHGGKADCRLQVSTEKPPIIVVDAWGRNLQQNQPQHSVHFWRVTGEICDQLVKEGLVEAAGRLTRVGFERWLKLRNERFVSIA